MSCAMSNVCRLCTNYPNFILWVAFVLYFCTTKPQFILRSEFFPLLLISYLCYIPRFVSRAAARFNCKSKSCRTPLSCIYAVYCLIPCLASQMLSSSGHLSFRFSSRNEIDPGDTVVRKLRFESQEHPRPNCHFIDDSAIE